MEDPAANYVVAQPTEGAPIELARSALSGSISRLREVTASLEGRLGPVLGPSRALESAATLHPRDEVSPLASSLGDAANGVEELVDTLLSILRRIEL